MKRKRPDITLWDACHVHEHGTMWKWWKSICRKDFRDRGTVQSDCIDDVNVIKAMSGVSKEPKIENKEKRFLTTFSVGLKPTPHQRRVWNLMLKVTNYTYSWCLYLVNEMNMRPNQFELQKTVCKTNTCDIDPAYRLPNDDWFFDNKMTAINTTACRTFCSAYNTAVKRNSKLKTKREVNDCLVQGSIGIQKKFVRDLNHKDKCRGPRLRHIVKWKTILELLYVSTNR